MKRIHILVLLTMLLALPASGQPLRGTTGLLHAPSGEMQKDGTFMFGGNWLDLVPMHWYDFNHEITHTYNYYVDVTMFSFFEFSYTCTLNYAVHGSTYFPPQSWGKYTNQDRSFNARIRLWGEGWVKWWTPQVVIGLDDPLSHTKNGGGKIEFEQDAMWDNHFTRYYLGLTKHLDFADVGSLGVHAAYVMNYGAKKEGENRFNRPTLGVNFRLGLPQQTWWAKALNGLEPIAEYDARTFNMGLRYNCLHERIHLIYELNDLRYSSAGLYFSIPLTEKTGFTIRDDRRIGHGETKPFQKELESIRNLISRIRRN